MKKAPAVFTAGLPQVIRLRKVNTMGEAKRNKQLRDQGLSPAPPTEFPRPATMDEAQERIGRIMHGVIVELDDIKRRNACILAGAILTKVLHRRGFPDAYPLTVRPMVFNPRGVAFMNANGGMPPATPEEKTTFAQQGGRMVAVGRTGPMLDRQPDPLLWPGHLAVVLPNLFGERPAILDPTITQANIPGTGIELPPLLMLASLDFVKGESAFGLPKNGSSIIYEAFPDDHSYDHTPDWTNSTSSHAARRILALL